MSKRNGRIPPKYPNGGKPWGGKTVMPPREPLTEKQIANREKQCDDALMCVKAKARRETRFERRLDQLTVAQRFNLRIKRGEYGR